MYLCYFTSLFISVITGPSDTPLRIDNFLQSIFFHTANLKVLHLNGLLDLIDSELAEIIEQTLLVCELYLIDMNVGTKTTEAIASNIPNVSRISICGSSELRDIDVRCLTGTCKNLTEITLRNCPKLTDDAFSRCILLSRLFKVDLTGCSTLLTGNFLNSFVSCPLKYFVLDGIQFSPLSSMVRMNIQPKLSLQEFSCQNNGLLTVRDAAFLLNHFVRCISFNFTDCVGFEGATPVELEYLQNSHSHPFVRYSKSQEFVGFKADLFLLHHRKRHLSVVKHLRRHHAAVLMQRLRRRQVVARKAYEEQLKAFLAHQRAKATTILQAFCRLVLARKFFLPRLRAGRVIVVGGQKYLKSRHYRKIIKARKHYRKALQRKLLNIFVDFHQDSHQELIDRADRLYPKLALRLKQRMFRRLLTQEEIFAENRLLSDAPVYWEINIKYKLIGAWKTLIGQTRILRMKLIQVFMNIVDLKTHNSFRQIEKTKMAMTFGNMLNFIKCWVLLAQRVYAFRLAESKIPMAIAYFERSFKFRVLSLVIHSGLNKYRLLQYQKRLLKKKGDAKHVWMKKLLGGRFEGSSFFKPLFYNYYRFPCVDCTDDACI